MATADEDRTSARAPLSRARVLASAVAVADAEGIGRLTMRRLAGELGVEAMSLYHHVANKEDLLDGMVDAVFVEIGLPDPADGWRHALAARSRAVRAALARHPWALPLLESRTTPIPGVLADHDAVLGCLRGDGFTVALAAQAFSVVDSYVHGFAMAEASLPFDTGAEAAELASEMMEGLAEAYPHLAELVTEHVMAPGYDYGDEFERGLELILDGLERLRGGA